MPDVIQLLPDSIANQIAAGEVVQRPASAVKELIENAIDAGAKNIKLIVREAGKSLIQVVDDGAGMTDTDARMCLERHATSKIRKAEDLFSIKTMGFRGEAMASIAAISQMGIKTKTANDDLGTHIIVEGSVIKKQEPDACSNGTSVSVKNLFFNIPARRNFLKSNAVEMRHIIDEFQRISLANPDVAFSLFQNDNETYNLPVGKLSQRIINLFGKNYQEQLAYCKEVTPHISIEGYIGKPEFAKKNRGEQFFFVNNRFIKNGYLHHAVLNAFEGLLKPDSHPFYVLNIEIDPQHVDVNVHPTKTEVKFDDERTVYGIVRSTINQALGVHNIAPTIDFEQDINFGARRGVSMQFDTAKDKAYSQFKTLEKDERTSANLNNWQSLYETEIQQSKLNFNAGDENHSSITMGSAVNSDDPLNPAPSGICFQIHNSYIAAQIKSGVILIDQQAAHERILFERYITHLDKESGASQQLLFPVNVELNPADFSLVRELQQEIVALGFLFEEFGKNTVVISGIPADMPAGGEKEVFEGLIDQFKINKNNLSISINENIARSLAKRSRLKHGTPLNSDEQRAMIDNLFACSNPNYTPSGQMIYFVLDLNKIASFFN